MASRRPLLLDLFCGAYTEYVGQQLLAHITTLEEVAA